MVDGALVLVDAAEGPLPQTKFVVSKALKMGLKPIVVINKVDRPDARPVEVVNEVFDLFAALDATDEQLDFPILYGSAKRRLDGRRSSEGPKDDGMTPLFDLVLRHVPPPHGRGRAVPDARHHPRGQPLSRPHPHRPHHARARSSRTRPSRCSTATASWSKPAASPRCWPSAAWSALPVDEAEAGDIVAIAGLPEATVADTICDPDVETPIPAQPIDPPTLAMTFRINDSPLAGTEGDKVTSRVIRDRLLREAEGNVALQDRRIRRQGFDGGRRPRRTAARHPDRDHAPRGLRAVGVAAEGAVPQRRRDRRAAGADRGGRHRRRRAAFRHRRAEAVRAQRRDDRDAPVRRRPRAAGVPRADPRPDRLPGRAPHRHARHRDHEPAVPRLRAVQGRHRRPPQRRPDLQRRRARPSPMRCGTSRTAAR